MPPGEALVSGPRDRLLRYHCLALLPSPSGRFQFRRRQFIFGRPFASLGPARRRNCSGGRFRCHLEQRWENPIGKEVKWWFWPKCVKFAWVVSQIWRNCLKKSNPNPDFLPDSLQSPISHLLTLISLPRRNFGSLPQNNTQSKCQPFSTLVLWSPFSFSWYAQQRTYEPSVLISSIAYKILVSQTGILDFRVFSGSYHE